jgi:hypothetical protein
MLRVSLLLSISGCCATSLLLLVLVLLVLLLLLCTSRSSLSLRRSMSPHGVSKLSDIEQ